MIYLDYAASSAPYPEVLSHIRSVASEAFGNPGALHCAGTQARQILQRSRFVLAEKLNVRPEEIFFTSGGTESNNWAIRIGCSGSSRKHIVCSAAEHSSVLEPLRLLQKKGYFVTFLPPNQEGYLSPAAVEAALRPDTGLLCVQAVNNETGVLQDVDALSQIAHRHRIPYFCDAVQSFGHLSQNLHNADLISLSAHKFGGPRGVGCLVVRQPLVPSPMLLGGGQELGCRSGTENIPGIAGFALAAERSCQKLQEEASRVEWLCRQLEDMLLSVCPDLEIAGKGMPRSSILCCRFPGIAAEEMVSRLDLRGICVSPGAACAARSHSPSHVLLSMGYTPLEAAEFVRFSPGWSTSAAEICQTAEAVAEIIKGKRGSHGK